MKRSHNKEAFMSRFLFAVLTLSMFASIQPVHGQTVVRFSSDWVFDGTTAYLLQAENKGYFKNEGLAVTIDRGFGAGDAVIKVASGAYHLGLADVTALIDYNAKHPEQPLVGIMMVYDKSAFSLVTLADKNIRTFGDLSGRKIGALTNETISRLFPVLARLNGFDISKATVLNVNGQIRDTLLRTGEVDAVIGFFSSTVPNLVAAGVPEDKVRVFKYSDYSMDLYGSAIVTSAAYAADNPKVLAGFLNALAHGLIDTIKDPAGSIPAVKARNNLIDEALELRRLQIVLNSMVVTPYTKAHGFGGIDEARLAQEIDFIAEAFDLPQKPSVASIFTPKFLPAAAQRQVP
jgi:NitT/TauT family transport system substrate-binding protein